MRRTPALLLAVLLALAACGDDTTEVGTDGPGDPGGQEPVPGPSVEIALEGRTFTAEAVEGFDVVPGTAITIAFTDDAIRVEAGCNAFTGSYSAGGADLAVRDIKGTQVGCVPEVQAQDDWITGFLSGELTMDLSDEPEGIRLTGEDGDALVLVATGEPTVDPDAPEPDADDPLAERELHVVDATGYELARPFTLTFASGQVGVAGGCNQLSGPYALDGLTLEVEPLGGTEMGCDQPLMEQDAWIAAFLAESPTVEVTAGEATALVAGDVTVHLTRPAPEPAAELVGPTWTLESLTTGAGPDDTAMSVPAGVTATISFAADGTYALAAGCNTGQGTYTDTGGGTYLLGPAGLTRRRCAEEAMGVEETVIDVLDGDVSLAIEGRRLTARYQVGGPTLVFTAR